MEMHRRKGGGAGDLFPEGWQIIYSAAAEEEENTRFLSHSMHAFIQSFPLPCLGASSIQHTYKKTRNLGGILILGKWPRASRKTGWDQIDIVFNGTV